MTSAVNWSWYDEQATNWISSAQTTIAPQNNNYHQASSPQLYRVSPPGTSCEHSYSLSWQASGSSWCKLFMQLSIVRPLQDIASTRSIKPRARSCSTDPSASLLAARLMRTAVSVTGASLYASWSTSCTETTNATTGCQHDGGNFTG